MADFGVSAQRKWHQQYGAKTWLVISLLTLGFFLPCLVASIRNLRRKRLIEVATTSCLLWIFVVPPVAAVIWLGAMVAVFVLDRSSDPQEHSSLPSAHEQPLPQVEKTEESNTAESLDKEATQDSTMTDQPEIITSSVSTKPRAHQNEKFTFRQWWVYQFTCKKKIRTTKEQYLAQREQYLAIQQVKQRHAEL